MIVGARRFQPRTSVRSGAGAGAAAARIGVVVRPLVGPLAGVIVSSSSAMTMSWSPARDDRVHRRVERAASPPAGTRPMTRGVLERAQRVAEGPADQRRLVGEVDLVAAEVEQLRVDDRQPGLPAGLGGDAGDEVADQDELDLVAADQPGDLEVRRVADLGDDVVRLGPAVADCW